MNRYGERIDKSTLRFERLLPGPIERVWNYLVDPELRATWFCGGPFDLKPGGKAVFAFDHRNITDEKPPEKYKDHGAEIEFTGTILKAEPPHRLIFNWPEGEGEPTVVEIALTAEGDKVRLTLTHSKIPTTDYMVNVSGGWHLHFDLLEALLSGAPRTPFWSAILDLEKEYAKRHGA